MAKHRPLPDLDYLHSRYDYDPNTGGLFHKGAEQIELNAIGASGGSSGRGYRYVTIQKRTWPIHRIVYFMFHRKDPGQYVIDHINGDPADNRIKNLRRCRQTTNAKNLRKKGKYVVDDEGVGRWVSDAVKAV